MGKKSHTSPQSFRDKRNHFWSKYKVVTQASNLIAMYNKSDLAHKTNFRFYMTQYGTNNNEIGIIDPFRAKNDFFFKVTGGPNNHSFYEAWLPPIDLGGDEYELQIPKQMSEGHSPPNTGDNAKSKVILSNLRGEMYNGHNTYRHSFIESIDFFFREHNLQGSNDVGLKVVLLSNFIHPEIILGNELGQNGWTIKGASGLGEIKDLLINENLTVNTSQVNWPEQTDPILKKYIERTFRRILNPVAYIEDKNSAYAQFAGIPLIVNPSPAAETDFKAYGYYWDDVFFMDRFVSTQAIQTVESLEDKGNFSGIYFADVDPVYNFLSTNYENTLNKEDVAHTKIPNIYNELQKLNGPLGMDGTSNPDEFLEGVLTGEKIANVWWSNYFKTYENMLGEGYLSQGSNRYKHVFVRPQGPYSNQSIDKYKELFPMYNDISFRSHSGNSKFMSALKAAGAVEDLWEAVITAVFSLSVEDDQGDVDTSIEAYATDKPEYSPYSAGEISNTSYSSVVDFKFTSGMESLGFITQKNKNNLDPYELAKPPKANETQYNAPVFNFDKWFKEYPESSNSQILKNRFDSTSKMFISDDAANNTKSKNPLVILLKGLTQKAEMAPQITKLASSLMRSYKDILSGKSAYNEVLFYRIQKKLGGQTLQNFWLENTPGIDILKYIDTQVKYGVDYDYRISAYTLVVGTKYKYAGSELAANGERVPHILDIGEDGEYKYFKEDWNTSGTNNTKFSNGAPKFNSSIYYDDLVKAGGGFGVSDNALLGGPDGYEQKYDSVCNFYNQPYNSESEDALGNEKAIVSLLSDYRYRYPDIFGPIYSLYIEGRNKVPGIQESIEQKEETKVTVADIVKDLQDIVTNQLDNKYNLVSKYINGYEKWIFDLIFEEESEQNKKLKVWEYNDLIEFEDINNLWLTYFGLASKEPISIMTDFVSNPITTSSIQDMISDFQKIAGKFDAQKQILQIYLSTGVSVAGAGFNSEMMSVLNPAEGANVYELIGIPEAIKFRENQIGNLNNIIADLQTMINKIDPLLYEIGNMDSSLTQINESLDSDIEAYKTTIQNIFGDDQEGMNDLFTILSFERQRYRIAEFHNEGFGVDYERATRMQVVSEPFVKVLEVPVYQETVGVVDDASLAPNVNFNSYFKNENRLLITLDNTVGEEIAEQILLPGDDYAAAQKIRRKQDRDYVVGLVDFKDPENMDYVNKKVRFKTDDYASAFQVFRKSRKPRNMLDYDGEDLLFTIDASKGSSFIDSIVPNNKYYYCFRTIDKHGHPSNPTPTYEIELVSDGGATFLLIDIVDFSEKEKGTTYKSFKRYMQIDPAFLQTLINQDKTDFGDFGSAFGTEPYLGVLEDSIFDEKRKFKIRITSRATGKKLDFNVRFRKALDETIKIPPTIL